MAIFGHRKRRRVILSKRGVIVMTLAGALCLWGYMSWRFRVIGTLVERQETGTFGHGEILLRTTTPESEVVLIGPVSDSDSDSISLSGAPMVPTGRVYRFDPSVGRIELFGVGKWAEATGDITFPYSDRDISTAPIKRDVESDSLSINGSPISTAGPYAVDIDVSPDRKFINVISANEERTTGNFFWAFGGGGYPRGPYYHEVFERLTGKKIGDTYTLQGRKGVALSYCWEAQGKYIVYHDSYGKYLWIVPGPSNSNFKQAPQPANSESKEKPNG